MQNSVQIAAVCSWTLKNVQRYTVHTVGTAFTQSPELFDTMESVHTEPALSKRGGEEKPMIQLGSQ